MSIVVVQSVGNRPRQSQVKVIRESLAKMKRFGIVLIIIALVLVTAALVYALCRRYPAFPKPELEEVTVTPEKTTVVLDLNVDIAEFKTYGVLKVNTLEVDGSSVAGNLPRVSPDDTGRLKIPFPAKANSKITLGGVLKLNDCLYSLHCYLSCKGDAWSADHFKVYRISKCDLKH